MAWEKALFTLPGALAAADLSAKQFYCVKQNSTNNQVALCTVDGERFTGVLQNKPSAANDPAEVMCSGVTKVLAAETLTAGDTWGTDNAGKAKKVEATATGADVGDFIAGEVLEGAGAGELATVTIGMNTGFARTA